MSSPKLSLVLIYESDAECRPMSITRSDDPHLILQVARQAIDKAVFKAEMISEADEILSDIQRAEADRLRVVLSRLIPDLIVESDQQRPSVM